MSVEVKSGNSGNLPDECSETIMTVDNPYVVDLVVNDSTGAIILILIEHRPWDGSDQRLIELQEKINNYVAFAQDGELLRQYPHAVGRPVRLELRYVDPPDQKTSQFLERIREALEAEGFKFTLKKIGVRPMG